VGDPSIDGAGAARARLYRTRQRLGQRIFHLALDEFRVVEALHDAGRLSEDDALNHDRVETALAAVVES
jgi:hypothetical protein